MHHVFSPTRQSNLPAQNKLAGSKDPKMRLQITQILFYRDETPTTAEAPGCT
jgi:hypothetical protein